MAAKTYYAWSEIRNGGTVETIELRDGRTRDVVTSRNVVLPGSKIKKGDLGLTDDEWNHLIETGSVRPYPMPEEASPYMSPTQAVVRRLTIGGDIDENMLVELAMTQPAAINPPADEEATVPEGA